MGSRGLGVAAWCLVMVGLVLGLALPAAGQRGQTPPPATPTPQAGAPIDLTGTWVSIIVDEWRFRVTPQKGDILYLPLNQAARTAAQAWDPAKDEAEGYACRAYGAVGVMQRPGRLRVSWENATALKLELDAGTQTRLLRFGPAPARSGDPSWQGSSTAEWQTPGGRGRRGDPPPAGDRPAGLGSLKVVTTNLLPGYIRKNGVPHSEKAVLTEYSNRLTGEEGDAYISLTAMLDDPTYLTQPFVRTYTFKKLPDAAGWDPTPCWPR